MTTFQDEKETHVLTFHTSKPVSTALLVDDLNALLDYAYEARILDEYDVMNDVEVSIGE